MKKVLVIILAGLISLSLIATEKRDFRFIEELYQRDNLSVAKQELEKFTQKYPNSEFLIKAAYYEAMIDFLQSNYPVAEKKLLKLENNSDQEIKPLVVLALIQTKFFSNDFVGSVEYADKFLQSYKNHSKRGEAYYWKGRIALERENLSLAETNLNKAAETEHSSMLNYLAFQIKIKQNKPIAAKAILDSTYSVHEDEFVNQIVLEWFDHLYQKLDYAAILKSSNYKVPVYSRLHSDYAIILGQAYYQLKRYDEALNTLKTIQPTTDIKQFHIALAYKAKGDVNLATTIFTELAKSSKVDKIKELSFFEMINTALVVPQGSEQEKVATRTANDKYFTQLTNFIAENPESKYVGNAYYLKGFIKYLNEDLEASLNWFLEANNKNVDSDTSEKLLFLIGDVYFLSAQKGRAISLFNYYQEIYPKGRYHNEVLYKLGLTYFDENKFAEANTALLELAKGFSNYKHISTAYFYLGEINTINNNYQVALDWFNSALKNSTDPVSVWLRISELNYLLAKWQDSFAALKNIPESPLYDFRVNLIKGNIHYNLKQYDKAIEHYTISSMHATDSKDVSLVTSRIGWTYYLKGDFALAERTFRSLSNFSSTSEDYLILAGNSALNGKRFSDAITLFKEFLLTYPVSTKTNYVKLNLGDSYYNLKKYKEAFDTYADILSHSPDAKELKNSLLGIKWTVLNHKARDYRSDLATLAQQIADPNISKTLSQITLLYENENEKWDDVIKTAKTLLSGYPQDNQNKVVNQTLALAYTKKNQYVQADSLYANLIQWHRDSELFTAWSNAFLARKDTVQAIKVLDDALALTNENDVWFKNLELKVASNNPNFLVSQANFMKFAEGLSKSYGQLLLYEWKLNHKEPIDLEFINIQADSPDGKISSLAFYLLGFDSFIKNDYEACALNMMKVIYLFPEYKEVTTKASYYLILSQHYQGHKKQAQQNFDLYHKDLLEWQTSYLRSTLFK